MFQRVIPVVLLLASAATSGQTPANSQKLDAAKKHLQYFVGQWKLEGTAGATNAQKPGKVTGSQRCDWFESNLHVVCRGDSTDADGSLKEIDVIGYNADQDLYTRYNLVSDAGVSAFSTGKIVGKVWQWTPVFPTTPKYRFSWTEASADAHTVIVEVSEGGKAYTKEFEGTLTRIK